jgi:hypothetical protein
LIKLRAQLALRRSEFSEAQNSFPARLAILEEQLAALGPAPESGTEPAGNSGTSREFDPEY